jgi:hypothetical protein
VEKAIEACGQKILATISRLGEANILSLPGYLAERSMIVYQALGWLAREGRIHYERRGDQVYIALRSSGYTSASTYNFRGG